METQLASQTAVTEDLSGWGVGLILLGLLHLYATTVLSAGNNKVSVALGDMDGDTDLDIVIGEGSMSNARVAWLENGNGWLAHTPTNSAISGPLNQPWSSRTVPLPPMWHLT